MKLALVFSLLPLLCFAQYAESPYSFNIEANTITPENTDGVSANVVELRVGFPIYFQGRVKSAGSISHERQFYNSGLGFRQLADTQFSLFASLELEKEWRVLTINSVRSSHEDGVDASDSVNLGGIYGAWYTGFSDLSIGGGVGYSTGIEDDFSVFPILLLDWNFTEEWTLTTRPTPGTRFGPGASVLYQPTDKVAVFLGALYLSEEFLLRDEEVFQYKTLRAFTTAQYRFENNISINLTLGVNLLGEIEFTQSGRKDDLDPGLFTAFNVSWDF